MPKVFWAYLLERSVGDNAVQAALDVAQVAGRRGFARIRLPYVRTDIARNIVVRAFQSESSDPDDVLVMLDNDHTHPPDIIEKLVQHHKPVVGALAFRRGTPYYPCAFLRDQNGALQIIQEYPKGLMEVTLVGTGAIAIQRRVFDELDDAGYGWPYFRYTYKAGDDVLPSEDIYFGESCESAGISHWLDTTLVTPHLTVGLVDEQSWRDWLADHPEQLGEGNIFTARTVVEDLEGVTP